MPSPFPGMDPWLEGSEWMDVHTQLCVKIAGLLNPQIAPKYMARTSKRMVFDDPEDVAISAGSMHPDVGVVPSGGPGPERSTATLTATPLSMTTVMPESVGIITVEIRDTARRSLVTAIEVLSPTNKRGTGRREYLEKRHRLLLSQSHLVEIDLLRTGHRVPMEKPLPSVPYFAFVGRANRRPIVEVYPIPLESPLPTIRIPLLRGDPDCLLDLQQAFTSVYDTQLYQVGIDYSQPPEIPLAPDAAAWAAELLARR